MAEKIMGIYSITNTVNGKVYVGKSKDIIHRWGEHRHTLRHKISRNRHLQRAWDKYGEPKFEFHILKVVSDPEQLGVEEHAFVNALHAGCKEQGYNIAEIDPTTGAQVVSLETRAKISAKNKGRVRSPEAIAKTAAANRGRKNSPASNAAISAANKGKVRTPEMRARISKARLGSHQTEETKELLRTICTGREHTPEAIAKMKKNYENYSPERKAQMSSASKGKTKSLEHRAKLAEATRRHYAEKKQAKILAQQNDL